MLKPLQNELVIVLDTMLDMIEIKQQKDKGGWWMPKDFTKKLEVNPKLPHFDMRYK